MQNNIKDELYSVSPIDGRYFSKVNELASYFSEYALIRYRVLVEIEYLIALAEGPLKDDLKSIAASKDKMRLIYKEFNLEDARQIKSKEATINHDVKAVEYFVKDKLKALNLDAHLEYVHFGLTSQDINNTAIPLSIKEGLNDVILPYLDTVLEAIKDKAKKWADIPMLAHTHGQPASPTKLGKELMVFHERLSFQAKQLEACEIRAKFGGATGNFNAHFVAFPKENWPVFGDNFIVKYLGLNRSQFTTQIEHYDQLAALFDIMSRINTILLDLNKDFWQYISMGYFRQIVNKDEVGSSAMPHKVNPIDFENSEGNLGVSNALFNFLSAKLPISRLQRDLTDSTVLRNIGVPFAHSLLAYKSLTKGLSKIDLNEEAVSSDLSRNWAVVSEAIQTILRREGYPKPYEALKSLTRGQEQINEMSIAKFIEGLNISDEVKRELKGITPFNYTGVNPEY